jgi:Ion channel
VFSVPAEWRRILGWQERRRLLLARLGFLIAATLLIALVGTVAVYFLERHAPGTEIRSPWDAFFFTTVQLLTVSSSLKNPIATGGRIVNIAFESWGVIFVAGTADSAATFFLSDDDTPRVSRSSSKSGHARSSARASGSWSTRYAVRMLRCGDGLGCMLERGASGGRIVRGLPLCPRGATWYVRAVLGSDGRGTDENEDLRIDRRAARRW